MFIVIDRLKLGYQQFHRFDFVIEATAEAVI
jgi:hypothetical protein